MRGLFFIGRILLALAFAIYGLLHFLNIQADASMVPHFVGGGTFWAYFVGFCWWAVALSFLTNISTRLSGWLAVLMLLLILFFVQLPHFNGTSSFAGIASIIGLIGGCILVAEEGHRKKEEE